MTNIVVYTDLDGTLLDHESYEPGPARELLMLLADRGIPVVPCTSKTRAEMLPICEDLGLTGPFIVENGTAVWIPEGWGLPRPPGTGADGDHWCHVLGKSRGYISGALAGLGGEWANRFHSLCDMSLRQVSAVTGLNESQARAARARHHSETLLWLGSAADRSEFARVVSELDMEVLQGGRFLHVLAGGGKGEAMAWLHGILCAHMFPDAISIAAGDAENDLTLLEAADHALVVRSPAHEPLQPSGVAKLYISAATGPAGWVEGITAIIEDIDRESGHGRFLSKRYHHYAAQSG